jgi:LacI family transcriptional regulator
MPTLEDVAKRANVSVATASRILSASTAPFRGETRERVLRASRELGYKPNLPARALASGKSHIIAAVIPRVYESPFTALGTLQILSGIEEACNQRNYHVLISSPTVHDHAPDSSFMNLLTSGYLDGVILDGNFAIDPLLEAIRAQGLPAVVIGNTSHPYFLRGDSYAAGDLLMRYLLDLGHRQIGVIATPLNIHSAVDLRLAGMRAAAKAYGMNFDALPRVDGNLSQESALIAFRSLMTSYPTLTAIAALNDRMALGALRGAHELNIRVPDEITIVGLDNIPQAAESIPGLTTVDQQLEQWGGIAVEMLLDLLAGDTPQPVVLPVSLVVRGSSSSPRTREG